MTRHHLARALDRLEIDGLVERTNGALRTTRRWHGAMALATMRLLAERELAEGCGTGPGGVMTREGIARAGGDHGSERGRSGGAGERDLRLPIAAALVDFYRARLRSEDLGTEDLADMLQALLPLESVELDPERHATPGRERAPDREARPARDRRRALCS